MFWRRFGALSAFVYFHKIGATPRIIASQNTLPYMIYNLTSSSNWIATNKINISIALVTCPRTIGINHKIDNDLFFHTWPGQIERCHKSILFTRHYGIVSNGIGLWNAYRPPHFVHNVQEKSIKTISVKHVKIHENQHHLCQLSHTHRVR